MPCDELRGFRYNVLMTEDMAGTSACRNDRSNEEIVHTVSKQILALIQFDTGIRRDYEGFAKSRRLHRVVVTPPAR